MYGTSIGISCDEHHGMHIWDDYVYVEVIDPDTGAPVPDGEVGELVLTTLRKQGARSVDRTHDLTRIIPGDCTCGFGHRHPRIDTLTGRTDDMFYKVKGCNIFPAQVEEVIAATDGAVRRVPGDDREHQRQGCAHRAVGNPAARRGEGARRGGAGA